MLLAAALDGDKKLRAVIEGLGAALSPLPDLYFTGAAGEAALKRELGVATLEAFGTFSRGELAAFAALLKYVEITQIGQKPMLRPPRRAGGGSLLVIDAATRANLELTRSLGGRRQGSLLAAIDDTVTSAGARELANRLASPLVEPDAINSRLDAVAFLIDRQMLRAQLRDVLKGAPDIARALSRLALGRGGPRDLGGLQGGLAAARDLGRRLGEADGTPAEIRAILARLAADDGGLYDQLASALGNELPHLKRDGGFVRAGLPR